MPPEVTLAERSHCVPVELLVARRSSAWHDLAVSFEPSEGRKLDRNLYLCSFASVDAPDFDPAGDLELDTPIAENVHPVA